MKKNAILLACLLGLILPATALAGKADKTDKGRKNQKSVPAQQVLKRFDKNADGKIDGSEAAALRKAFEGKNRAALKGLDTNKNGKLDDDEIAAIHAEKKGKRTKENKKK